MNLFSNLLDGMMFAWPNAIVVAAIFVTLLYHPERIVNRRIFKVGCLLFALSLIAPALISFLPAFSTQTLPAKHASGGSLLAKVAGLLQPFAFTLGFLCLTWSLMTRADASND